MDNVLHPINNLYLLFKKITGTLQPIKKQNAKSPIVNARREETYQSELAIRAPFLPKIDYRDRNIVDSLTKTGTYSLHADDLGLASTPAMLDKAAELSKILQNTSIRNDLHGASASLNEHRLIEYPEIFLWGLETKILDIVENYLGLPVVYRGVTLRRDLPAAQLLGIRQWHLDRDDRQTVKIIVYLEDVDFNSSPYEYISRELTALALRDVDLYEFDSAIQQRINNEILKSQWQTVTGKAGTIVLTDMANVLHRVKPQATGERLSLTFSYTSHLAPDSWQIPKFTPEQWKHLEFWLSYRQKRCLFPNN